MLVLSLLITLWGGLPSLGICPGSVPVLLPAEEAADQRPLILLTVQPSVLGFLLEPPGQDLGES